MSTFFKRLLCRGILLSELPTQSPLSSRSAQGQHTAPPHSHTHRMNRPSSPMITAPLPGLRAHTYHLLSITVISRLPLSRTKKNGYPSCNEYNRFSAVSQYKSSHFPSRSGSKLLVTPNRRPLPAFCIFIRFSYFSLNLKILSFFFGGLLPSILSGMGS